MRVCLSVVHVNFFQTFSGVNIKKMSNVFDKSWESALSVTVSVSLTVSVSMSVTVSVDPCDMLNNFCFHVYAQKWHTVPPMKPNRVRKCLFESVRLELNRHT